MVATNDTGIDIYDLKIEILKELRKVPKIPKADDGRYDAKFYLQCRIDEIISVLNVYNCVAYQFVIGTDYELGNIIGRCTSISGIPVSYRGLSDRNGSSWESADIFKIGVYAKHRCGKQFGVTAWGFAFEEKVSGAYFETRWTLSVIDGMDPQKSKVIAGNLFPQ